MNALPHEDAGFGSVIQELSLAMRLEAGLIEKDYWITHVLWALHAMGLEVRFKGGTCLSKAYALIDRFSETSTCSSGPAPRRCRPPRTGEVSGRPTSRSARRGSARSSRR